jgi:hypothetical protein
VLKWDAVVPSISERNVPAIAPTEKVTRVDLIRIGLLISGVVVTGLSWWAAWGLSSPVSANSFLPLWLGYVATVNGLSEVLYRESLLSKLGRSFALLFLISIPFWWFFELIDFALKCWHYEFDGNIFEVGFSVRASMSFGTVIPALLSTAFLLYRCFEGQGWRLQTAPLRIHRPCLFLSTFLGVVAFALLWLVPKIAFPLVWIAPLITVEPLLYQLRYASFLDHVERGDWCLPVSVAGSALICGLLWELWNEYSHLRWVYAVPNLGFWKVFEMPVLGYFGYPFFGLIAYRYATFVWVSLTANDHKAELIGSALRPS